MNLQYSDYAIQQLENILFFLVKEQGLPFEKAYEIRQQIFDKVDLLFNNLSIGQREEYLDKLSLSHRRLVVGNYKIIYLIEMDAIIITDIFDTLQDPTKMKG